MNYNITEKQLEILNSLICERLSSNDENLRLIEDFTNSRNEDLESLIKGEAFEADETGERAFYIVKNKDNRILIYFSLHASLLHKRFPEIEQLQNFVTFIQDLEHKSDSTGEIKKLIEEYKSIHKQNEERLKRDLEFIEVESGKKATETFPSIELGYICVNESMRDWWNSLGFGEKNRIGITLFWHCIVPKILETVKIIGAKYISLKAADKSEDNILLNHYKAFMGFEKFEGLSAVWSIQEYGCHLLVQEISKLQNNQKDFFKNFNRTSDD